ncbi:MAG: arginine--tRNA ligase [Ectothiorhodospiraceae bacterium]|nr:arginine--tRNA ligase [Chromatiales bacterium]MCP5156464.1 arginine--tRNA ligase [Ectothiorhodospiraceae bacterium]
MKPHLQSLLEAALARLVADGLLAPEALPDGPVPLERSRGGEHGDFASPIALGLARSARRKPRELADAIVARLPASPHVRDVQVAGPGFVNFFLDEGAVLSAVSAVLEQGAAYGRTDSGQGARVQVEFVSANPTGPLHVGHGRGAAYGAALASVLDAAGFEVQREYYVNDAGRQMHILATSVWVRYLQQRGEAMPFPANAYRGDYIRDVAAELVRVHGDALRVPAGEVTLDLPPDVDAGGDREIYIDALCERARHVLGAERYAVVHAAALGSQLDDIREDLEQFGVTFDRWFSEASLHTSGAVARAVERLRAGGHMYEREGAQWFRSTAFGDEKDRVVVRDNGEPTYFASDIAYVDDKFARGFERMIYIWGADHHGYVTRVKAACQALGHDPERIEILLVQFATLYRGGEKLQMSTRSGEFVTLRELRREVGDDAARFFYVMRRCEQHLDFDLDLAKSQSAENPVYYVQYAHARICSLFRQAAERGVALAEDARTVDLSPLVEPEARGLARTLGRLPEVVTAASLAREPHQIAFYLREVANDFHAFYNNHVFLADHPGVREARFALARATRQVIANGLALLGVGAPEEM